MYLDLSSSVVVFDLDDTLYPEAEYVSSGVRYVCSQIQTLFGKDMYDHVKKALEQDPKLDWLALACESAGVPDMVKESMLWMYRLHLPNIFLSATCKEVLQTIRSASNAVAVLTDGRSVTQRLKLKALGLADWPAYISEDFGAAKPSPERFIAIQADYCAKHYIYVADNIQKDFLGCNPLGWISICMRGNQRNVHSQLLHGVSSVAMPAHWVNGWQELSALLVK